MGFLRWGWVDERPDADPEKRKKAKETGSGLRRKATDRLAKAVGGEDQPSQGQRLPDGSYINRG